MDPGIQMIVSGSQLSLSLSLLCFPLGCFTLGGHLTLSRVRELETYNHLNSKNPSRKKTPPFHITSQNPRFDSHWPVCKHVPINIEPIHAQKMLCFFRSLLWLARPAHRGVASPAPIRITERGGGQAPQKSAVTKSKGGARADKSNLRSQGCFYLVRLIVH